jgi:hypothetical protein
MLRSTNRELGKSALIVVVAAGFGMMLHQVFIVPEEIVKK